MVRWNPSGRGEGSEKPWAGTRRTPRRLARRPAAGGYAEAPAAGGRPGAASASRGHTAYEVQLSGAFGPEPPSSTRPPRHRGRLPAHTGARGLDDIKRRPRELHARRHHADLPRWGTPPLPTGSVKKARRVHRCPASPASLREAIPLEDPPLPFL